LTRRTSSFACADWPISTAATPNPGGALRAPHGTDRADLLNFETRLLELKLKPPDLAT
jgi:hypothetical protein